MTIVVQRPYETLGVRGRGPAPGRVSNIRSIASQPQTVCTIRARGLRGVFSMDRSTMTRLSFVSLLLLAAAVSEAQEKKCRDIAFPERMQLNGSELTLNGLGV